MSLLLPVWMLVNPVEISHLHQKFGPSLGGDKTPSDFRPEAVASSPGVTITVH